MKHDLTLTFEADQARQEAERKADRENDVMAGCGGRCHAFGCSKDCCLEPFHDGPHRCYDHK